MPKDSAPVLTSCTREELMVIEASRYLQDWDVVFVGTGLPLLATTFAQRAHAPNIVFVAESGPIAPLVLPTPISVSDPRLMHKALRLGSLREVLGCLLQRGLIDIGFLGGAQIDQYANINSTVIGDYAKPTRRLPGSGGGNDIASHCRRLLIITPHEKRRFPPRVDYLTSPGYLDGPDGRRRAGLSAAHPEVTIVTDLCVMDCDPATARLRIVKLMPGVSVEQVKAQMLFEPAVAPRLDEVAPPEADHLRVLRDEVDPGHVYLKASAKAKGE